MWIAQQGICAELPEGWGTEESPEDGEIVYIDLNTGERTFVHPCDEYYKQLVAQERRKRPGAKGMGLGKSPAQQMLNAKQMAMQQPMSQPPPQPKPIDPLVKMQQ